MMGSIKAFLRQRLKLQGRDTERAVSLQLATAAILLEVSRADFEIDEAELRAIADALSRSFDIGEDAVRDLIADALDEDEEKLSLYPFLQIVNDHCDNSEKFCVIVDLWRVAFADGRIDKYEEYQIRRIAELLYVPHGEFIRAKLMVQEEQRAG